MPNVEGSNPFARFSLGNGRLCFPSLTRSGLSAFAARSQRRGSANRNGDPDFAELSSNPFARFSLGTGRLCLPSLTRSGLSAFAARSHMNQVAKKHNLREIE